MSKSDPFEREAALALGKHSTKFQKTVYRRALWRMEQELQEDETDISYSVGQKIKDCVDLNFYRLNHMSCLCVSYNRNCKSNKLCNLKAMLGPWDPSKLFFAV